jgi:6-phosphogluconolactonase
MNAGNYLFFTGSYASAEQEGIHYVSMNKETGALTVVAATSGIRNPSYLALDERRRMLYAVSETGQGEVTAYDANFETGELLPRNTRSTDSAAPCHVTVCGNVLAVANYMGGFCAYPLALDGSIGEMTLFERYEGAGFRADRQEASHPHSVFASRDARFLYVSDLGLDTIVIYSPNQETGVLTRCGAYRAENGAGPRHMAFHPSSPFAYSINELDSTITALAVNEETGALTRIETVSTLPEGFSGSNTTADIHVSPCGNFLYGTNRGDDSIAMYRIDAESGRLTLLGHVPSGGRTPRNFAITPDGKYVLAANQDGDNIAVFHLDAQTGLLSDTGERLEIGKPVCIRFVP